MGLWWDGATEGKVIVTVSIHKTKEAVPKCGSYEVRYSDGRVSVFFHYDDEPRRRLRPEQMTREQALEAANRSPEPSETS
jgi:hypothetical protein